MSRRDTIIIAVLINAGLMVMLFISALKKDPNETQLASSKPAFQKQQPLPQEKVAAISKFTPSPKKVVPKAEVKHVKQEQVVKKPQETKVAKEKQAPLPKQNPTVSVEYVSHTVKKGEVLEKIARNYKTSVDEIIQINRLSSTTLQIGQELKLPKNSTKMKKLVEKPSKEEDYYIVKNGDNLWKIAIEHHLRVEDLLKLNDLNEKKAKALRPGDRLRIR